MAKKAFGNSDIFLEKFISNARHIEIQVFGLSEKKALHFYERDCSIQRRFQKIIEESPAPQIEKSIIDLLVDYSIPSHKISGAPGVYVDGSKIAALGLKVKRGKTYHGLSLNVDMNLSPYKLINPCGYRDLNVTQMSNLTDNNLELDKIK